MSSQKFTATINAPKEKVWKVMLEKETYQEWTGAFHAGSTFEGSWEKGSDIQFVSKDDGKISGMAGKIADNIPNEYISIEYVGLVTDGVVDATSEYAKPFIGAHENYTFAEENGVTTVLVELEGNLDKDMADMFEGMWPKALEKLKEIAEQ